ncbi:signal peptide peptidase SppA [candidate division WOR-3 bacterium]|nr:signal peptide peptidase SppA [candidate division WOR-3 bacterium]
MIGFIIFILGIFEGNSVSTSKRAISLFTNPAGLGINPGSEVVCFFDTVTQIGLSSGNLGFGAIFGKERKPNYIIGNSFNIGESFWLGYNYKFGESKKHELGGIFRPSKFISLGLCSSIETTPNLRGGLALNPGTDRITVFGDIFYKCREGTIRDYLYGIGIEPLDGIILSFKGNKANNFNFGLEISLGNLKIGANTDKDFNKLRARTIVSHETYPTFMPKPEKLAEFTIKGSYPEMKEESKYFGLQTEKEPTFYNLLNNLESVKNKEDVKAVFINFKPSRFGIAQAEELRQELLKLKKAGKKIIVFSNGYGFGSYYLASVADYIILTPLGDVVIPGISVKMPYIKGALEKLGIETDIERVGKYKSATELFEREDMSKESKEQIGAYLDDIWKPMVTEMAKSRKIEIAKFEDFINKGVFFNSDDALDSGLVDTLAYWDELDDLFNKLFGKIKREPVASLLSKKEISRAFKEEKPKIALFIAEGSIVTGESGYDPTPFIGGKYMGSETVSKLLNQIRKDKSIKALVFRVNSGGGSALASEIIAQAVKRVAKEKPVIVSMSNVAGSGGYYISCFGNKILADRFTLTGSIGVLGLNLIIKGLYDKFGLSWDQVKRGEHADYFSDLRHLTKEEREKFKKEIEWYYDKFISRVAKGRKLTKAYVDSIGQGRIWSGTKAKEIGLIDEVGGLLKAIDIAKLEAGIKKEAKVVIFPKPEKKFSLELSF